MENRPASSPDAEPLTGGGVVLRLLMFFLLGAIGRVIFPIPFLLFGTLPAATLGIFLTGIVANAIVVRIWEAGTLANVGLDWRTTSLREAFLGAAFGAVAAAIVVGGPVLAGMAHFEPAPGSEHPWASFLYINVLLLFGAMGEELLFRGYGLQLLARVFGPWWAIIPIGLLFGLAHLGNPDASAMGIANTALWGCLFGYAYWRTRALWLPIGLHFGWNAVLPLFGVSLSGFTMGVTGHALEWNVGELWSGGKYGPEGSVLTTLMVVVLFALVRRQKAAGAIE